jgi:hypothetical protein
MSQPRSSYRYDVARPPVDGYSQPLVEVIRELRTYPGWPDEKLRTYPTTLGYILEDLSPEARYTVILGGDCKMHSFATLGAARKWGVDLARKRAKAQHRRQAASAERRRIKRRGKDQGRKKRGTQ